MSDDPVELKKILDRPIPTEFKDRAKFIAFAKSKPPDERYNIGHEDCPMTQFVGRLVGYGQIPDEFKKAIFNYRHFQKEDATSYDLTWGGLAQRLEALP
jgi:hypothetical protein